MSATIKKYTIGGKKYEQRKLVYGQIEQLQNILKGIEMPAFDPRSIVAAFGPRLLTAIAVVLIPEGLAVKDKTRDLEVFADELRFVIEPEQVMEIVNDFFICNPIAFLLEALAGTIKALHLRIRLETGSTAPFASSAEEISPNETLSSGGLPPKMPVST